MTGAAPAVIAILAVSAGLVLYRVLAGPTIFDRLVGLSMIGTTSIILLLLLGVVMGRVDAFVDITLAYALISLVSALSLAKYFERTETPR